MSGQFERRNIEQAFSGDGLEPFAWLYDGWDQLPDASDNDLKMLLEQHALHLYELYDLACTEHDEESLSFEDWKAQSDFETALKELKQARNAALEAKPQKVQARFLSAADKAVLSYLRNGGSTDRDSIIDQALTEHFPIYGDAVNHLKQMVDRTVLESEFDPNFGDSTYTMNPQVASLLFRVGDVVTIDHRQGYGDSEVTGVSGYYVNTIATAAGLMLDFFPETLTLKIPVPVEQVQPERLTLSAPEKSIYNVLRRHGGVDGLPARHIFREALAGDHFEHNDYRGGLDLLNKMSDVHALLHRVLPDVGANHYRINQEAVRRLFIRGDLVTEDLSGNNQKFWVISSDSQMVLCKDDSDTYQEFYPEHLTLLVPMKQFQSKPVEYAYTSLRHHVSSTYPRTTTFLRIEHHPYYPRGIVYYSEKLVPQTLMLYNFYPVNLDSFTYQVGDFVLYRNEVHTIDAQRDYGRYNIVLIGRNSPHLNIELKDLAPLPGPADVDVSAIKLEGGIRNMMLQFLDIAALSVFAPHMIALAKKLEEFGLLISRDERRDYILSNAGGKWLKLNRNPALEDMTDDEIFARNDRAIAAGRPEDFIGYDEGRDNGETVASTLERAFTLIDEIEAAVYSDTPPHKQQFAQLRTILKTL